MKFVAALATRRYWIPVSRRRRMGTSGRGSTLVVSTSEAAQSCRRPSIRCTDGMQTRKYAMRTSTTSTTLFFQLRSIKIIRLSAGWSGFRVDGRYRR